MTCADGSLRNNRDFWLKAIQQNGAACQYLPRKLHNDEKFMLEAVKIHPQVLLYWESSTNFMLKVAMANNHYDSSVFKLVAASLRANKAVVLEMNKRFSVASSFGDH